MTIEIRPPRLADWRACRILLPESFGPGPPPEAFLAWDTERGALAGLAVFHRAGRDTIRLQALVLRPYRRRGIGSALLRRVCERAAERRDERIWSRADLERLPEASPFLAANGFSTVTAAIRIEADLDPMRQTLIAFRDRLAAARRIPSDARIVHSSRCRPEMLVKLYREMLAPAADADAGLAAWAVSRPEFQASVLMSGNRPAGILVGRPNDGRGTGTIDGLAVAPEFRGGCGWANLLLLVSAADLSFTAAARRIRFETAETNWNIRQQIERMRGVVTSRLVRFRHDLP